MCSSTGGVQRERASRRHIPATCDKGLNRMKPESLSVDMESINGIVSALGREPGLTKLGIYNVMWSEHCSYKSSRVHLRQSIAVRISGWPIPIAGRHLRLGKCHVRMDAGWHP